MNINLDTATPTETLGALQDHLFSIKNLAIGLSTTEIVHLFSKIRSGITQPIADEKPEPKKDKKK